jgi:hypothetical protein
MTSSKQVSLPPHNRKRQSRMARTKKTQTRLERNPSRKVTKSLKLRNAGKTSSRKAWKTRKKGRPKNSRRKTGKMRKMRIWRMSVLWKRCIRRGPEGSQGSSSKKKIMIRSRKRRTKERKRARKMKRGERKRSRRRPKRREKKSRRMRNRRKSRR